MGFQIGGGGGFSNRWWWRWVCRSVLVEVSFENGGGGGFLDRWWSGFVDRWCWWIFRLVVVVGLVGFQIGSGVFFFDK